MSCRRCRSPTAIRSPMTISRWRSTSATSSTTSGSPTWTRRGSGSPRCCANGAGWRTTSSAGSWSSAGRVPSASSRDGAIEELQRLASGGRRAFALRLHGRPRDARGDAGVRGAPLRLPAQGGRSPHLGDPAPHRAGEGGPRRHPAGRVRRGTPGRRPRQPVRRGDGGARPRPAYGTYLDRLPGITLSTCNLVSLFGLHRRWRGALVGHLALFEMCSVGPMGRYQAALERFGLGRPPPASTRST